MSYNVIVGIQWCKRHCATEISLLPLGDRVLFVVQVFLGKAEVHDVHVFVILRQHKIGLQMVKLLIKAYSFDISMDEPSVMHFLNRVQHLDLYGYILIQI